VLLPTPTPDGLHLSGFEHGPTGQLQLTEASPAGIAQCKFELIKALHVGPTGFAGQRTPLRCTAKVGLLDRQHHRFVGNVCEMPPSEVRSRESEWSWQADAGGSVIVRCERAQVGGGWFGVYLAVVPELCGA